MLSAHLLLAFNIYLITTQTEVLMKVMKMPYLSLSAVKTNVNQTNNAYSLPAHKTLLS